MELEFNQQLNDMTNGYYLRLVQCYRPHTAIPSRQELMETKYEESRHFNLKGLAEDVGIDYDEVIKSTKD